MEAGLPIKSNGKLDLLLNVNEAGLPIKSNGSWPGKLASIKTNVSWPL